MRLCGTKKIFLAMVCGLPLVLPANPYLLNDRFADGERATQALPESAAWFATAERHVDVVRTSSESHALKLSGGSTLRGVMAYFAPADAPVSLKPGGKLTLSAKVTPVSQDPPDYDHVFRVMLLHSRSDRLTKDEPGDLMTSGYMATFNGHRENGVAFHQRVTRGRARTGSIVGSLMRDWRPLMEGQGSLVMKKGITYSIVLEAERRFNDDLKLTCTVSDGTTHATGSYVHAVDRVYPKVYDFDTVAFAVSPLRFSDVEIGHVTVSLSESGPDLFGEKLYNGIVLPAVWPPRDIDPASADPMPVPYLENPPAVIPIDVGRQMFVDDFLIQKTSLKREFHYARKYEGNPVLKPETPMEHRGRGGFPVAVPKSGGVWLDPADGLFKMWYEAGWLGTMAYAVSVDGIHWERPATSLNDPEDNSILDIRSDSTTVWIDHEAADPSERFKMFLRGPGSGTGQAGYSMTSPDGIHWGPPVTTGNLGDRSTMFYNPFRKKWVYSSRFSVPGGRARYYHEHDDFLKGAAWNSSDLIFWAKADRYDLPDPEIGDRAQLYNLDAVAYESLILGFYQIYRGPHNEVCKEEGIPKITELNLAYSRDGFHWYRPDRETFIASTRQPGDWDRGYVQSVGGVCLIVGDELWFYYSGFRGDPGASDGMYANGSTGIAKLRRDGFVSLNAPPGGGILTTRPVTFKGKRLFVNVDNPRGRLRVEVLDRDGNPIEPFTLENSLSLSADSTLAEVRWKGVDDLSALIERPVRFRFHLEDGKLYAFWVSPDESGASRGYVAAGGPGFTGPTDTEGKKASVKQDQAK